MEEDRAEVIKGLEALTFGIRLSDLPNKKHAFGHIDKAIRMLKEDGATLRCVTPPGHENCGVKEGD